MLAWPQICAVLRTRAECCLMRLRCCAQYAEMEMRHRFINHARNVWDRAVTLLPRVDQLWYKVGGTQYVVVHGR